VFKIGQLDDAESVGPNWRARRTGLLRCGHRWSPHLELL